MPGPQTAKHAKKKKPGELRISNKKVPIQLWKPKTTAKNYKRSQHTQAVRSDNGQAHIKDKEGHVTFSKR